MKKILFIASMPFYLEKGSSLRSYSILENLSQHYQIDLATYSLGKDIKIKNTKIYRTPKWFKPKLEVSKPTISKIILDILLLLKVINLSIKNKYNIIHCEDFEALCIGYFLKLFNKKSKFVWDLHNRPIDNLDLTTKNTLLKKVILIIEKNIIKKVDLIILNWGKYLQDSIFENKNKFVYYDKMNLNIKKYSLPYKKYITYSGNFEPYQGVKEFLNVFKDININIKIVLVGQPNEDILNFVKENKLNDKTIFTGRLTLPKSNYLIKRALFCILPRTTGVQPSTKMIHYLSFGKAILASNIEANRELLIKNKNAFLYSKNDELKTILNNLLKNPDTIKNIQEGINKTKKEILDNWEVKRFLKNYEK